MTNPFLSALREEDNFTLTENQAVALKSTQSSLVDLFGEIGVMRSRNETDVIAAFNRAFAEDKLLALRILFYARDIRGGLGERKVFRTVIKHLAQTFPDVLRHNIKHITIFGRWDDLYELIGTPLEKEMWQVVRQQWNEDLMHHREGKPVSLLAKWLKSCNTSSKESRRLGRLTAKAFGLNEGAYRKSLSTLRKHIGVVEIKMSAKQWGKIDYEKVTSRAMTIYRGAFGKRDPVRFSEYIARLAKGEVKINASTLYPYDIMEKLGLYDGGNFFSSFGCFDPILEAQWKALPNYVDGENNILVMADTSASMNGRPIYTAIGLAMYFAERNKGAFKDTFMTFSTRPSLVTLKGETLHQRITCIPAIVSNTDLEAAFNLILRTAINHRISQDQMPKSLIVISDMQFDAQVNDSDMTWHNAMVKKFKLAGYEMPNIVYWNVRDTRESFQATSQHKGVQIASGQSAATFKSILANVGCTPFEAMVNTVNVPRYACITV